jgi:hypothetical protein
MESAKGLFSSAELIALRLPLAGNCCSRYERIPEDRLDDVARQQCQPQDPAHYDPLRLGVSVGGMFFTPTPFLKIPSFT